MQANTIYTEEAPNKWWAARDRQIRNTNNKSLYTQKQITRALRMKLALEMVYAGRFYDEPSYGTKGISVKIENARVTNAKELKLLETAYEQEGITKRITPRAIIYRITK